MPSRGVRVRALSLLVAVSTAALGVPAASSTPAPDHRAVGAPAGAPVGASVNGSAFQAFGAQYMTRTRSVTLEQALGDAVEFDVIAAKPQIYAPYLARMRVLNPRLVVYTYLNASMAESTQGGTYPDDWYVRDADGVRVRSKYGAFMMDVAKRGWIRDRRVLCQRLLVESGYDGCFLDILGPGVVNGPFGPTGQVDRPPVDPRTGVRWTAPDWMAATGHLADVMQAAVAPKRVSGNGIGDGVRYFGEGGADGTRVLLTSGRSMLAEGFLRGGRAPIDPVPDLTTWRAHLRMIDDAESRGLELLLTTKTWTTATRRQKDQVHEFSLGTYLLAARGRTRWAFLDDLAGDSMAHHPWWTAAAALGPALGARSRAADGLYERAFVGGRVLVNPGTTTISRSLGLRLLTLDGVTVGRVTLPPHSAKVLRNS